MFRNLSSVAVLLFNSLLAIGAGFAISVLL
jgi:hypothetical protein